MKKSVSFHSHTVRIYQEDVDGGSIVYHSNYLKYAERARTEWLRAAGLEQSTFKKENQCHFVVTQIKADYRLPAYLDDELEVRTDPFAIRGIRLSLTQKIFKSERLCVDILVHLVLINDRGKPVRLPDSILKISEL